MSEHSSRQSPSDLENVGKEDLVKLVYNSLKPFENKSRFRLTFNAIRALHAADLRGCVTDLLNCHHKKHLSPRPTPPKKGKRTSKYKEEMKIYLGLQSIRLHLNISPAFFEAAANYFEAQGKFLPQPNSQESLNKIA